MVSAEADEEPSWGYSGANYFGATVGATFGLLWGYFGATLELLWGYFGATLGLLWDYFGATLGLL